MVKKIVTACMLMALGSTVYAAEAFESNTFIGLELESTKNDVSLAQVGLPTLTDKSNSVIEYGVRIGAENDEWRTTVLYTYYNDDDAGWDETMHKGSLLIDYFFWNTRADAMTVKPYIGAHVGYMTYELTDNSATPGIKWADTSGIFYGLQAGVAMTISEVIGLDLSYKYSLTGIDIDTAPNRTFALDNMGSIAFSINYFY